MFTYSEREAQANIKIDAGNRCAPIALRLSEPITKIIKLAWTTGAPSRGINGLYANFII